MTDLAARNEDNMSNEKHTPLPWELDEDGWTIRRDYKVIATVTDDMDRSTEQTVANAAYIVRAANIAPQLATALESLANMVALGAPRYDHWKEVDPSIVAVDDAREALRNWRSDGSDAGEVDHK